MIRGITFAALLIAAPSFAQQAPANEPSQEPDPGREHLMYNLAVKPETMFVVSDCEDSEGNEGEWVYQVSIIAPDKRISTGTRQYPSRDGIVKWSDNSEYKLETHTARLRDIEASELGSIELHLRATEWDPENADASMDDMVVSEPLKYSPNPQQSTLSLDGGRCGITLSYTATWEESRKPGIYDVAGNMLFRPEKDGELLYDDAGHEYYYDENWTRISRDGGVIISYHYNQRKWDVVEDLPIITSPVFADRYDKDLIERSYRGAKGIYTATNHDDYPLLTLKDGIFTDELGNPVYKQYGRLRTWHRILLLHRHYQAIYKTDAFNEIREQREIAAAQFAESNSHAVDILEWSEKYEGKYKKKEVLYFAEAGGEVFVLTDDQMSAIKNAWLVLNEKTNMMSWPHYIPEASFKLSKGKTKKRGVAGVESRHFVLELKVHADHVQAFYNAVSL